MNRSTNQKNGDPNRPYCRSHHRPGHGPAITLLALVILAGAVTISNYARPVIAYPADSVEGGRIRAGGDDLAAGEVLLALQETAGKILAREKPRGLPGLSSER